MKVFALFMFVISSASAFVSRVRSSDPGRAALFAGGFSRGPSGGESLPVGYNRKPKPKPNAQRPSVRPTKAPKGAAASSSTNQALIGRVAQDVDPASPCGCGSGSAYSKCCGIQHMSFESSNTPEQVLRARYTAFKYGLADYIIDSTHTSNEDFQKFMVAARATKRSGAERWKREILQLKEKEDLGFLGLDVVSTEVTGDFASVIFRALFLQGASAVADAGSAEEEEGDGFLAVEEKCLFERTAAGKWLYKDGETTAPEADVANSMIDKWAGSSDKAGQTVAAEEAGGRRRRSAAKQAYLDSLPAQVAGAGGKADGLVREGASDPRAPWLDGTAKRKQSSGGLNDKSPIRPFASGRA